MCWRQRSEHDRVGHGLPKQQLVLAAFLTVCAEKYYFFGFLKGIIGNTGLWVNFEVMKTFLLMSFAWNANNSASLTHLMILEILILNLLK